MKAAAIIPARWGSTRFPGKPLHPLLGKPLIQHVWERCCEAKRIDRVIVATDDMRIAEAAFDFGAEVSITSPRHPSGTDRIAEVAARLRGVSCLINVQGDEPAIDPGLIDRLVDVLEAHRSLPMVTAACPFARAADFANPNNVKVVTRANGDALYFSRSPIPFDRDGRAARRSAPGPQPLWHLGLYGYRTGFLRQFVRWKPTPLEQTEKLEQLRVLEHGVAIRVVRTAHRSVGVDTPGDVPRAIRALKALTRSGKPKPIS